MIYKKMLNVMKECQHLQKDMTVGSGNYAYKAISESKVTSEVRKSLIKHGLVFYQSEILKNELIRLDKGDKTFFLSLVTVRYILADAEEKDQMITVESIGSGIDSQDKSTGKALTYSYKYALLRTFMIPTGEDPDRHASVDMNGKEEFKDAWIEPTKKKLQAGKLSMERIEEQFYVSDEQKQKLQ